MNSNIKHMKKRTHLPLHVYLIYLLAATLIFTGVTFSKYITSTTSGDEARVAAFGNLELKEPGQPEKYMVTPGVNISKNPQVSFGSDETSEMAVYVFVAVSANNWQYDQDRTYKVCCENETDDSMTWSVANDWEKLELIDDAVFYQLVSPGEKMQNKSIISGDKITVSRYITATELENLSIAAKSITFKAYAVQVQGFDTPEAAWASISGK